MTLSLAVTFKNFQNFTCLSIFFYFTQLNRNKLWYPPNCMLFAQFNHSTLSYIILALSSVETNLPNKTLIFHDFQGPKIRFHDFPGLENEILKFHDFPGIPWPVQNPVTSYHCSVLKGWQRGFPGRRPFFVWVISYGENTLLQWCICYRSLIWPVEATISTSYQLTLWWLLLHQNTFCVSVHHHYITDWWSNRSIKSSTTCINNKLTHIKSTPNVLKIYHHSPSVLKKSSCTL